MREQMKQKVLPSKPPNKTNPKPRTKIQTKPHPKSKPKPKATQDNIRKSKFQYHLSPDKKQKQNKNKKQKKPAIAKGKHKKQQRQSHSLEKIKQAPGKNIKIVEEQLLNEISPRFQPIPQKLKKILRIEKKEPQKQANSYQQQKIERVRVSSPKEQFFKELSQGNYLAEKVQILCQTKYKQIDQLSRQNSNLKLELNKSNNRALLKSPNSAKLFLANILQQQDQYQQFLETILSKSFGRIKSTKLIYQWHPKHTLNIHQLVDNIPNLVFIILTEEGYYLSAYSEQPFKKPFTDRGYGIIVSLTSRKVFTVLPQKHAISYDGAYIIFGNSQILLKREQISSNFGKAGGYYPPRGQNVDILFGQGLKSETKIKQMQIFQLQH